MTTHDRASQKSDRRASLAVAGIVLLGVAMIGILLWSHTRVSPVAIPSGAAVSIATPSILTPHTGPRKVADIAFVDGAGHARGLAQFKGKVVLLNVWATWCGPCRKEMPTLDRLQSRLGSRDFEVVALSIDHGGPSVVKTFYDEIGVRALAVYVDATGEAQGKLDVIGVPTTLLIDREGREVSRYTGPAEWDRPDVVSRIQSYLGSRE